MDGEGRDRFGDAGAQSNHAGDIGRFGGLGDASENHLVDQSGI